MWARRPLSSWSPVGTLSGSALQVASCNSAERLSYFRFVGGCASCQKSRSAFFDGPWNKLEVVVSPYLTYGGSAPTQTFVYALRASDLTLVVLEPPKLVLLPRTDNGIVFMMTVTATLQYNGQTLWTRGIWEQ